MPSSSWSILVRSNHQSQWRLIRAGTVIDDSRTLFLQIIPLATLDSTTWYVLQALINSSAHCDRQSILILWRNHFHDKLNVVSFDLDLMVGMLILLNFGNNNKKLSNKRTLDPFLVILYLASWIILTNRLYFVALLLDWITAIISNTAMPTMA